MADIFISYSRNDSAKALSLAEQLRANGMDIWIDQHGIEGATSWSKEIANALQECHTMLLLLSPTAVASQNVAKELSVATQLKKRIVPIQIVRTQLEGEFLYHLSALQRVKIEDFDAIVRAISGAVRPAQVAQPPQPVDDRKSLMILPFEDLSPTGDNQWFSDGIVSELIDALSNVRALRLMDTQATKEFKNYKGQLSTYATTMQIRYFVQGDVRKFGDQIKISARLLDIDTGDYLWKESIKGTMEDVFEIQEQVAEHVVEGLKLHLTSEEQKKLAERGTENAEAYELYLKAEEYFARQTKEMIHIAVQLITEAIALDRDYAKAYQFKALALVRLYGTYDRDPAHLEETEALCKEALRLRPDLFSSYFPLMAIHLFRGDVAGAEAIAKEYVRKDPLNFHSYFTLSYFYYNTGQRAMAIAPLEEMVRLKPGHRVGLWNLVAACDSAGEREKCAYWASVALTFLERHLKLHPDDANCQVERAGLLVFAGSAEDARAAVNGLSNLKDGGLLYNTACIVSKLGDKPEAIRTLRKAIEAGFSDLDLLQDFLTDERSGIPRLADTSEYQEVKRMVEQLATRETTNG